MLFLSGGERRKINTIKEFFHSYDRSNAGACGLHRVFAEGKLVQQQWFVPANFPDGEQEFKCLNQMNGTNNKIIIPLSPIVIQLNAHELTAPGNQLNDFRRRLFRVERMPQVDDQANVIDTHLLYRQQRSRRTAEGDVRTRLFRFVLNRKLHRGSRFCNSLHAAYGVIPELHVICLKGIIEAVLARPELDIVSV